MANTSFNDSPISSSDLFDDILYRIICGELKPGENISENVMCAHYNISRTMIRSAITRLLQLNFVVVYPQRGTFVKRLDSEHIVDASIIRAMIEKNAVYELCYSKEINQNFFGELEYFIKELSTISLSRELTKEPFLQVSPKFHLRLIEECYSQGILTTLLEIRMHLLRWSYTLNALLGNLNHLIELDNYLFEYLKKKNLQKALLTIDEYYKLIVKNVDDVRVKNPEYFL